MYFLQTSLSVHVGQVRKLCLKSNQAQTQLNEKEENQNSAILPQFSWQGMPNQHHWQSLSEPCLYVILKKQTSDHLEMNCSVPSFQLIVWELFTLNIKQCFICNTTLNWPYVFSIWQAYIKQIRNFQAQEVGQSSIGLSQASSTALVLKWYFCMKNSAYCPLVFDVGTVWMHGLVWYGSLGALFWSNQWW